MTQKPTHYYVPEQSYWPLLGALGLFITVIGLVQVFHQHPYGWPIFLGGSTVLALMAWGWLKDVITESREGLYSAQMDRSFRWGMFWFIVSEAMLFGAFFGALLYARCFSVPWLGGIGAKVSTHTLLWQDFKAAWPLLVNPNPIQFKGPLSAMAAFGIPALNTGILLASGATLTAAHHALHQRHQAALLKWLGATLLLASFFLFLQIYEYHHAYTALGLTLNSGIYGSTFFLLTGFHGAHVAIGTGMLTVMFFRAYQNHFSEGTSFAFEATAWYWHFVDAIWLLLFVLVYWL